MNRLFLSLSCASLLAISSCNNSGNPGQNQPLPNTAPAAQEMAQPSTDTAAEDPAIDTTVAYVDSFKILMEEMEDDDTKVPLPPIYTHEVMSANENATDKFTQISKLCHGKMKVLVNAKVVAQEIAYTVKSITVPESDLLILIDKTYSMLDDIQNVKQGLSQIIDTIKRRKGTRLAIAFYGDKNSDGLGWYSFRNFETNYDRAKEYIASIKVGGGGDIPESVYDAVMKSMKQDFWTSTKKRNIILVGDAPPLEAPLSDYSLNDLVTAAKGSKTVMNFYPIIITPEITQVKMSPAEVAKYKEIKLTTSLYPNPTKGQINVGLQENGEYYMEIYNSERRNGGERRVLWYLMDP